MGSQGSSSRHPRSGLRGSLTAMLCLVIVVSMMGGTARASEEVDLDALLSEEGMSETTAQALVAANPGIPFAQQSYDRCDPPSGSFNPTYPDLIYKRFPPTESGSPIYLDEYDPPASVPAPEGGFTVMILAHGGIWRSCKTELEQVAWEAAGNPPQKPLSHYYIVLNINFRLPCSLADPNLLNSPIRYLCGWPYTQVDNDGSNKHGAGIHDVQSAVHWLEQTWPALPGRRQWNGRIVLLGTSGGGMLTMSAVAPSPSFVGGSVAADVDGVASWSGALKLDQLSTGAWPCDPGESNDAYDCALAQSRWYLACSSTLYPDPACQSPQNRYFDASSSSWYTNSTFPHAYIANAGGDPGFPELQSLQAMLDFEFVLTNTLHWTNGNQYLRCVVTEHPPPGEGPPPHGRALRNHPCPDDPLGLNRTVWQQTADLLG